MIRKFSSFAGSKLNQADDLSLKAALGLESRLILLSRTISMFPERSTPWEEVLNAFNPIGGQRPDETQRKDFVRACKLAHRLETSLQIDRRLDATSFVKNPVTLRLKFYYKNDRTGFLEWTLKFSDGMGFIYGLSATEFRTSADIVMRA